MAEEKNPMDAMFPDGDNPEYHRKKAEYEEQKGAAAESDVLEQHGHLADRLSGQRVRKNPPQAAAPVTPPPRPEHLPPEEPREEPRESTGLEIDPSLASRHQPEKESHEMPVHVEPNPREFPIPNRAPKPAAGQTHPFLQKLRQDFGIESIPLEDIKVGPTTFTMRVLDGNSVTTAVRFADTLSLSPRENELHLQTAMAAFAVVAIDGEPLWKVFDTPLEEHERVMVEGVWKAVFDPLNPPERVRMMASTKFMDFLSKEATMELQSELWDAYQKRVDPKGSLEALLGGYGGTTQDLPLP
jgi:hypothetical protein